MELKTKTLQICNPKPSAIRKKIFLAVIHQSSINNPWLMEIMNFKSPPTLFSLYLEDFLLFFKMSCWSPFYAWIKRLTAAAAATQPLYYNHDGSNGKNPPKMKLKKIVKMKLKKFVKMTLKKIVKMKCHVSLIKSLKKWNLLAQSFNW